MNATTAMHDTPRPAWYMIAAIAALLWNLLGIAMFGVGFLDDRLQLSPVAKLVASLAIGAYLVLALAGSWFALRGGNGASVSAPTVNETVPQVASLDLRPLAVTRSEEQKGAGPLEVPRGRVNATILLPVGSSPGMYEVRILDHDLRVRASTTGSAEIRNYITTLEAMLDTSGLDVGDYQLTLRREGGEWQMFPLRVR